MKLGCEVIYESMYEIHVSGHACQEELKIIQSLVKPQYFIPVHGERKHLISGRDVGIFLLEGLTLFFTERGVKKKEAKA